MIKFIENNELNSHSSSLNITYPRNVNIIFGNYPFPDRIHNLMLNVKSNLDPNMKNYTNVKGGMTSWDHFVKNDDFIKFVNYTINKHQVTHPNLFKWFYQRKTIESAWGNMYKKGDSLTSHMHYSFNGILFLSKGCDLILPELNITLTPNPGDYYYFPPMIYHGFEEILNDEERCSIAFNIDETVGADFDISKEINDKR